MSKYYWSVHRPGDDAAPAKNRGTPRRHAARDTTLALDRRYDAIRAEYRRFSRDAAAVAAEQKGTPGKTSVAQMLFISQVLRHMDPTSFETLHMVAMLTSHHADRMIAAQGLHPDQVLAVRVTFPPHGQGEARFDIIPIDLSYDFDVISALG